MMKVTKVNQVMKMTVSLPKKMIYEFKIVLSKDQKYVQIILDSDIMELI